VAVTVYVPYAVPETTKVPSPDAMLPPALTMHVNPENRPAGLDESVQGPASLVENGVEVVIKTVVPAGPLVGLAALSTGAARTVQQPAARAVAEFVSTT
jgi:hypothetical protein